MTLEFARSQKYHSETVKCVPCQGNHPVNYKDCTAMSRNRHRGASRHLLNTNIMQAAITHYQQPTYTKVVARSVNVTKTVEEQLTIFLNEFKSMLSHLISQNNTILNNAVNTYCKTKPLMIHILIIATWNAYSLQRQLPF